MTIPPTMTTELKSDTVAEGGPVAAHVEALENEGPEPKVSASTIMAVFVSNIPLTQCSSS